MAFDTSKFKNYADLLAQIDAAHQAKLKANPSGSGDGYNSGEADNFSTMLNGQGFSAKYDTGTNHLQSLSSGMSKDPLNYALSQNPDGSIGQRSFSPASDYKLFGGSLAAMLGPLAAGGAFGGAAGGFSNAALGLDAQGFALNPLASLGAGAPTAAEAASGVLTTTGAAGGAGGLTAAQIASGVSAAGAGASLLNGANMPDTTNPTSFSDAGYAAQNGIDPTYTNSGTAPDGRSWSDYLNVANNGFKIVGGVKGLLGSFGGLGGAKQTGNLTTTNASQIDPRLGNMLYGDGTANNTGALGRILSAGTQPQTAGTAQFGQGIDNYLGQDGLGSFVGSQQRAQALQGSNIGAPQMTAAQIAATPAMQAAQINAPGQNGMNLSGAYNHMINGNAGANPYLTNALQSAVGLTNASYDRNATNLTNNLQRNILPGINDAAFAAGQYGSSRQGIAQGNAISDYTNQLSNSNLQLGLANSANTTGQQAQSFNQGQDRSLSALNNLSGNQYSTAAGNAGFQQQANSTNYGGQLQTNIGNAGFQQQANANNQQSQLQTNQLNSVNQIAGVGLSSSLLNQANTYGQANNSYGLDRAKSTAGGLSPFAQYGQTETNSKPIYQNQAGNITAAATGLGGIFDGLGKVNNAYNSGSGIFSSLSNLFG